MKYALHLVILLVSFSFVCCSPELQTWQQFKEDHSKTYRSSREDRYRFKVFKENIYKIRVHNKKYHKGETSFRMGVNAFTDRTGEELEQSIGSLKTSQVVKGYVYDPPDNLKVPKTQDWRKYNAVSPVKNQLNCGACWAFAALTTIETHLFISRPGNLTILSVQHLVDCAIPPSGYKVYGCEGGELPEAYRYIREHGVIAEKQYPYLGEVCKSCSCKPVCQESRSNCTHIKDFAYIDRNNETSMMAAVGTLGPVAVGIDARLVFSYHGGIIDHEVKCGNDSDALNHGVAIVGYGSENGNDYWIVKNSWGPTWGEDGFFRIKRGVNQCGIALIPSFPIV